MRRRLLIKRISIGVFLIATCSLAWDIRSKYLEMVELERIERETGWIVCHIGPPRDSVARFHIELLLSLVLIGNRLKRLPRILLNVTGLTGLVVSYILWWQHLFHVARNAEVDIAVIPNFAYLVCGNFLDLVIAAGIGLLVILNVRDAALSSFRLTPYD